MAAYATVDQYRTQTASELSTAGAARVGALLDGATAVIAAALPEGYAPDPALARVVCIQMVQRAIVNPGGRRYRQIGSTSEGYDTASGVFLSDQEREQLLAAWQAEQDQQPTAGTIRLRDEAYPPGPPCPPGRDQLYPGRERDRCRGW